MTARASRSESGAECAATGRIARGAARARGERLVAGAITARMAAAHADPNALVIPTESIGVYTLDGNPLFTGVMARFTMAAMRTTWLVFFAILAGSPQT